LKLIAFVGIPQSIIQIMYSYSLLTFFPPRYSACEQVAAVFKSVRQASSVWKAKCLNPCCNLNVTVTTFVVSSFLDNVTAVVLLAAQVMVPSLCISLSGKRKCSNCNKVGSAVASARSVTFLLYRGFQEESTILSENFPYGKLH